MTQRNKPAKRTCTIFIRELPRDVKDQFKAWCAVRGVTMTAKIEQLMRSTIKNGSKLDISKSTGRAAN